MKSRYITPSVTIFKEDGTIDTEAMGNHFDRLIEGGVDGILIFGSIGEFFAVPMEEKKRLIKFAARHIDHRVKLLVGTTSMMVEEILELSRYAHSAGADACIILPPYYFPLSEEGVEHYYDAIARQLPEVSLYLYNFPDRTGYTISVQTTLNLLRKYPNIIGYKDTQAGMAHSIALIKAIKPEFPDFEIYAGFDDNFAHNVLSGGDGCIAGLSNFAPELCHAWVKAFEEEDLKKVQDIQKTINGLMEIYQVGVPFVPYIKTAMIQRGEEIEPYSSFPFMEADAPQAEKISKILQKWMKKEH